MKRRPVYYNEWDKYAAAWLRELIKAKLIPEGEVDERDIREVKAKDLKKFTQCHFFAGIGGWAYALQIARWSDAHVWTGSCPCQPWSFGGEKQGFADERHLWPDWFELIRQCKPSDVLGEQVVGAIKLGWFDQVITDLESQNYAVGGAVLAANDFGADHERKRLFWGANSSGPRWKRFKPNDRISRSAQKAQSVIDNIFARARRALDGDFSGLLHSDGISVQVERDAIKCYGNAFVPQACAEFIKAYKDSKKEIEC